ncbi:MAG: LPS export ABC transporter protein LptC [Desulforhopalus sp.]|jgi:LPS export ABC transporter protein LptC
MRLITKHNLFNIVIIAIVVWLAIRVLGNARVLAPETTFELIPDNIDLSLKNIKYTKTHGGAPLWTLVADSAAHSMEEDITRIKNVRMTFFDPEIGDIELTADLGKLTPQYQRVTFNSNVMMTSPSGDTLQTDYLEYEETSNILQTDRMVKINRDYFILSGKGMQMNIAEQTLVLLNDVKVSSDGMDTQ